MTSPRLLAPWFLTSALALAGCQQGEKNSNEVQEAPSVASNTDSAVPDERLQPDSIVVYYFHGDRRCTTCKGIQSAIQNTVQERFSAETASGQLVFREVNTDEKANAHFVEEFDLTSSAMVLVAKAGEKRVRWDPCSEVWPLAHKEKELASYTEKQIRSYLDLLKDS